MAYISFLGVGQTSQRGAYYSKKRRKYIKIFIWGCSPGSVGDGNPAVGSRSETQVGVWELRPQNAELVICEHYLHNYFDSRKDQNSKIWD